MKTKVTTLLFFLIVILFARVKAQEIISDTLPGHVAGIRQELDVLKRIKISGYIQAQYQITDSAGSQGFAGGNFAPGVDKRFILRESRLKLQYDAPINEKGWSTSQFVFQIDASQNGLALKDMYAKFTDPWSGWFSITAGMQNRPFGFEIVYSSSLRESPDRGRMSQIIFPGERDLGAMLTIQGTKLSNWDWIKLDLGMFNGTGAPGAGASVNDFDKFKDFIGHIGLSKSYKSELIKWGLGASYYKGGFRQDVADNYKFGTDANSVKGFMIDKKKADINTSLVAQLSVKRTSVGFDGQINIDWLPGITTLRAEYIQGKQPATSGSSASPSSLPSSTVTTFTSVTTIDTTSGAAATTTTAKTSTIPSDIYTRNFNGAYFYFLQNIGNSPWQTIIKYDWYDPNTDIKGDEIGKSVASGFKASNATDLKYSTWGFGLAYRWDANVKLTAYYDLVTNETSKNLSGATNDIKDNVFTLRAQVKF